MHAARYHWDAQASEPDYGFLMVDAKNAFNQLDRTMMLYVVRYLWPQGARYVFNTTNIGLLFFIMTPLLAKLLPFTVPLVLSKATLSQCIHMP